MLEFIHSQAVANRRFVDVTIREDGNLIGHVRFRRDSWEKLAATLDWVAPNCKVGDIIVHPGNVASPV